VGRFHPSAQHHPTGANVKVVFGYLLRFTFIYCGGGLERKTFTIQVEGVGAAPTLRSTMMRIRITRLQMRR